MSRDEETMNEDKLEKVINSDPGFEQKLVKALEIEVPELRMPELPDVETEKVVSLDARRGPSKVTWFAMAATVVIAAFIGFRIDYGQEHDGTLEEQVLAHLDGEPRALRVTDVAVSDGRLASVVPAHVATMNHDAGLITYAMSCRINGRDVPHLVIQGERGPVTILLMPEESIDEAKPLEGENVHGVILPVGEGSIAIIGAKDEALDRIQRNVLDSVAWGV